jgi:hypothetical protein
MWWRLRKSGGLLLGLLLLFSSSVAAAEFSAQMVIKDGDKTMPGKILVQNGKMRQEFSDVEGRTVTIVRPDKKLIYVVMPLDRTYVEMPLLTKLPGQFIQIPPDAVSKSKVGTETVNGYQADKYEVGVRLGSEGVAKYTFWVAPKLGVPIKVECKEKRFCMEYKNIKEGGLTALLFDPPKGYRKTAQPTGFTDTLRKEIE